MAAYKDELRNTWFCQFYYKDWQGVRKQKKRRGFLTRRDALEWERQWLSKQHQQDEKVSFKIEDFVKIYFEDRAEDLRPRTIVNKHNIINKFILPYFGELYMEEITAANIIKWQNEMKRKNYSQTYLRVIQNQLTALYIHACKVYDLKNNPCKKGKEMGKADAGKFSFWTKEQFNIFINTFNNGDRNRLIFEILFWTGCREGELLALTSY